MSTDDQCLLEFIDDSIVRIDKSIARLEGTHPLDIDDDPRYSILWQLEHLADATTRLSTELRRRHPEVSWDSIRLLRNTYAHGYLGLDMDGSKRAIEQHLPALQKVVVEELGQGEIF